MNETFDLPVTYKGKDVTFPATLSVFGYTYKIAVDVQGTEVIYEADEEKNYRAIIDTVELDGKKMIDKELLKTIAEAIAQIVE